MKKIVLALMVAIGLFASEEDWGYVCSNDEVIALLPKNYSVESFNQGATMVYDMNSVKVDKKKGTVEVWVSYILYPAFVRQHPDVKDMGLTKQLKLFNMKAKSMVLEEVVNYTCTGLVLDAYRPKRGVEEVVPDTMDETLYKKLKKQYF